jgi:hypothetical protein
MELADAFRRYARIAVDRPDGTLPPLFAQVKEV